MDLLERAKQKLEESKKVPDKEIFPDSQDEKILPEEITPGELQPELSKKVPKSNSGSKKPDMVFDASAEIDKKLDEKINERLLKLLKVGVIHELTIENLIDYIKTHKKKTKLYKLVDFFKPAEPADIERMFKYLYYTKVIGRTQDNWYYLK